MTDVPITIDLYDDNATAITIDLFDDNATAIDVLFKATYKRKKTSEVYLGDGYIGDRISNRLL